MMHGYKLGLLLMGLSCWVQVAGAGPAVGVAAAPAASWVASGVKPDTNPEEDYQAGRKADLGDDMLSAARLYRRAAEHGHAMAQVRLGEMLWDGSAKEEAVKWFRKAAEQGNANGQYNLAMMYMADQKEPKFEMKRDFAEARKWLVLAADQGNRPAITTMADAYINGTMDLDEKARSGPEALKWIRRAADVDDAPAIKALANAYRSGQYGLAADTKQADELDAKWKKLLGISETKKKTTKTR